MHHKVWRARHGHAAKFSRSCGGAQGQVGFVAKAGLQTALKEGFCCQQIEDGTNGRSPKVGRSTDSDRGHTGTQQRWERSSL